MQGGYRIVFALALSLLLSGCSLFVSVSPPISWENYDFTDGLGNLLAPAAKGFVGTPIESGAAISDFQVERVGDRRKIWGASVAVVMSDDGGQSWQVVEDSMKHQLLDFEGPGRIRFDSSGCAWVATGIAVFRSSDGGTSWGLVYRGLPDIQCVGYSDMEIDGNTVWLVSHAGTVTTIGTDTLDVSEIYRASSPISDLLLASDGRVFICTADGILVSGDSGRSFAPFSPVMAARDLLEVGGSFYCATNGTVVEIDTDGLVTWTFDNTADWISYLAVGESRVYALSACTSGNYLVTIDAGNGNAVHVSELGGTSTAGDVYFDGDGVLYVGLSGRVLISSDGGQTFEEHPFGISTVSVIESKHGQTWAGLIGSGAAYFDTDSSTWRTIGMLLRDGGLASYISAFDISPSQTILAGNSRDVAITYDGGKTYQYFPFVSDVGSVGFGAQNFTRDAQNALFMLQGRCDEVSGNWSLQVYRSNDEGITWALVSDFCQMTNGGGCAGILVIDAPHSCSWAAVNGYAFQNAGLYRGDQQCRNWALVDELNLQSFAGACLGSEGNIHVFASGDLGGGIYSIGSDGDWSFTAQPQGLVTFPSDFLVDADGGFWIASEVGLFYSADTGGHWVQFTKQDGLASDIVNCVCVEGSGAGKVVWVGTALGASRGVFTE